MLLRDLILQNFYNSIFWLLILSLNRTIQPYLQQCYKSLYNTFISFECSKFMPFCYLCCNCYLPVSVTVLVFFFQVNCNLKKYLRPMYVMITELFSSKVPTIATVPAMSIFLFFFELSVVVLFFFFVFLKNIFMGRFIRYGQFHEQNYYIYIYYTTELLFIFLENISV